MIPTYLIAALLYVQIGQWICVAAGGDPEGDMPLWICWVGPLLWPWWAAVAVFSIFFD